MFLRHVQMRKHEVGLDEEDVDVILLHSPLDRSMNNPIQKRRKRAEVTQKLQRGDANIHGTVNVFDTVLNYPSFFEIDWINSNVSLYFSIWIWAAGSTVVTCVNTNFRERGECFKDFCRGYVQLQK